MNIIPFVHEGLGNSSYLVGLDGGLAALVDPDRSIDRYLAAAAERDWRIAAVFETHLHADFVSGARELAASLGIEPFLPEGEGAKFPHRPLKPGERTALAGAEIEAIASPGHTPEHLSFVFRGGRLPAALFSGGALTAGGAARTDLLSPELTKPLTHSLYHTLREAFVALPDETALYPTHGGGSFCSSGSTGERTSTLGRERAGNPLLAFSEEDEFVQWFPTTFPGAPAYFFRMRSFNQAGPRLRREVPPPPPLEPAEFQAQVGKGFVIDTRPRQEYAAGHIQGALSNPLRDAYATWLGWLAPPETPLFFVTNTVPLQAVLEESMLVGYERFGGWLAGGMAAWSKAALPLTSIPLADAGEARKAILQGAAVVDVREHNEYEAGHIEGAINIPLGELEDRAPSLPRDRPMITYCGVGDRGSTAASLLERASVGPPINLEGGFGAWRDAGYGVKVGK